MSTKIYNGIKFEVKDVFELYEKLNIFKDYAEKKLIEKYLNKRLYHDLKNIMKDKNLNIINTWDISNELSDFLNKNKHYGLQNKNYIQIYPHQETNTIYGYYVLDYTIEKDLLEEDWNSDFHYQNQSDPPENIDEHEYAKRSNIWDDLFGSALNVDEIGMKFNILTISEYVFMWDKKFNDIYNELLEIIPREKKMKRLSEE